MQCWEVLHEHTHGHPSKPEVLAHFAKATGSSMAGNASFLDLDADPNELQATPLAKAWENCVQLRRAAKTFQLVWCSGLLVASGENVTALIKCEKYPDIALALWHGLALALR